ncbi:anhydro-N-acetylmuramic acid kinase [Alloalcanivorax mobilis]|uniref:anhydro-N-acetylmuramic acid kinase n=1 Tax=Alloalcanivorax mobilis TaxID=2019569 RepID=UPI000C78C2DA|nr:anhydro-N-acetylmuramic acid kinase [Alloalcanivorax mobilis]
MSSESGVFAGLMTGTSLDGVDAVLAVAEPERFRVLAHHSLPLPDSLRDQLQSLCLPGDNEIDRAGPAHRQLGQCYAEAIKQLLTGAGVDAARVTAIGCHGQTVRHRPGPQGFSLQLGCADTLACDTGIPVINDFRNKDMVLGGQGAPLAPRFHQALFGAQGQFTVVLNLGGIANITLLDGERLLGGFDTGPANTLLDQWYRRHQSGAFDRDGAWSRGGRVLPALLERLLRDRYFHRPAPKSTGREDFNLPWLEQALAGDEAPRDVQATLAELTARSVADALRDHRPDRLLVCGGGAHNSDLMARLSACLGGDVPVQDTGQWGLQPDQVEAAAFAWLAWAYWHRVPGNAPLVTGARREAVLGHLTLP